MSVPDQVREERAAIREQERRDREAMQARQMQARRAATSQSRRRVGAGVIMGPSGMAHLADGPASLNTLCTHKGDGEDDGWVERPDLSWASMPAHIDRCRDCLAV